MATPRRRLVRLTQPSPDNHGQRARQLQRLRGRLDAERANLARWMSRLKRAFHGVEKIQVRLARIERQIARWEE